MSEHDIRETLAGFVRTAHFDVIQLSERDEAALDSWAAKDQRFLIEIKIKEDDAEGLRART